MTIYIRAAYNLMPDTGRQTTKKLRQVPGTDFDNMDLKQKVIMAAAKREAYRFMKYCEKAKKLMLKANTRKKK